MIATKVEKDRLAACTKPEQIVIDPVNLDPANRPRIVNSYQGICWQRWIRRGSSEHEGKAYQPRDGRLGKA